MLLSRPLPDSVGGNCVVFGGSGRDRSLNVRGVDFSYSYSAERYSYSNEGVMSGPVFDHERLDVYRLSIEYVGSAYLNAKRLGGADRHIRDQWLRAAQSVPLNIAEGNGKQSLKDKNRFFEIARGSALECAAIHDILESFAAVDDESNRAGKSQLKRIVSMLTRLIQRSVTVAEKGTEYEYRSAEYD